MEALCTDWDGNWKKKTLVPVREPAAGFSVRNQALYRKVLAKTVIDNDDDDNNNNKQNNNNATTNSTGKTPSC